VTQPKLKLILQDCSDAVVDELEKLLKLARDGNIQGIIVLVTETGDRGYLVSERGMVRTGEAMMAFEAWKFKRFLEPGILPP
jgi:hypothetical protein